MKDNDLVVCINKWGWADEKTPFKLCDGPKKDEILTVEYSTSGTLAFYEWPGSDENGTRLEWRKDQFVPLNAPTVDEIVEEINSHHMLNIS